MVEVFLLVLAIWAMSLANLALRIERRSVRRALSVSWWLLLVVLLVLVGVRFGWRVPVTMIAVLALAVLRLTTKPPNPGRVRTTVEFFAFALIGMALGVFAFGGAGGIFGFTAGVVVRLSEIPTTGVFRSQKPPANGPRSR
jgi:hypothetical protein